MNGNPNLRSRRADAEQPDQKPESRQDAILSSPQLITRAAASLRACKISGRIAASRLRCLLARAEQPSEK